MRSTRSSTVKRGCFSGLTRIAIVTWSNTDSPRPMMSRCPLVMGSNEPGKTASERFRWPSRLRAGTLGLPPVEAETVVAHADVSGPRKVPYSLRERPFVEVLGHDDAVLGQQAPPSRPLEGRLVEVAVVGRIDVDEVEALAGLGEGGQRGRGGLADDAHLSSRRGEGGGVGPQCRHRLRAGVDEDDQGRPAGERFEPHVAGAGEGVEEPAS